MQIERLIKQKGITIIALIITIIVMLILVGVTVTVALNGGLFTTAKQAVDETQIAIDEEQLLEISLGAIDNQGKVNFDKLYNEITKDKKFKLYNEGKLEQTEEGYFKLTEETEEIEKRVYESESGNIYIIGESATITEGVKIVGGDVDGDGSITNSDVELFQDYMEDLNIEKYILYVGDIDGDDNITSNDLAMLKRLVNGALIDGSNINKVLLIAPKNNN